jgi:hypothetical protein
MIRTLIALTKRESIGDQHSIRIKRVVYILLSFYTCYLGSTPYISDKRRYRL